MGFLERLFGKKKEKKAEEPPEESFDIEAAAAFLKKKHDENLQLLDSEVKNAMFQKKRSVRNKRLLNLFVLSKKNELIKPISDAEKELEFLKKNIKDGEEKNREIDEKNRTLQELKKKLVSEEKNLRNLEASDEWNKFGQLSERKKALSSRISEARADISKNFSKIEKPLRKFQHLVKIGREKIDDERNLDEYLDSPVDALIKTENFAFINSVLERVKRCISSDAFRLKDKNGSLSEIDSAITHNIFEEIVKNHDSLMKEMKEIEEDMTGQNVERLKNEIEIRIENLTRDAQVITTEIERSKTQLETIDDLILERKDTLKKKIRGLK